MSVCFWDVPFGSVKITEKGYEYNQDTMELVIGLGVFWPKTDSMDRKEHGCWHWEKIIWNMKWDLTFWTDTPYVLNWHLTSWASKKQFATRFFWSNFMQMGFLNLNKFLTKSCHLSTLVAWFVRDVRTPLVLLEWLLLSHFLRTLPFRPSSISFGISRKVKSDSKPLSPWYFCVCFAVFSSPAKRMVYFW